jgi:hypothetical protein
VLHPQGGALKKMLLPFQFGLGGKLGDGKQYFSWISLDDLVYAIYHLINQDLASGAYNLSSTQIVTNSDFTKILSQILKRPAFLHLNAKIIKMLFGEMGEALLLSSIKAYPSRLVDSGFIFTKPTLESALSFMLGKEPKSKETV